MFITHLLKKVLIDVWTHFAQLQGIYFIYLDDNKVQLEDFNILKKHSLKYVEHNYIRETAVKRDLNNLSKNALKEKLPN